MAKLTTPQLYKSAIRLVTIVFGSLFNDIYIRKYNKDGSVNEDSKRKVPITFSSKEQYAVWIMNTMRRPDTGTKVGVAFPRLSYELVGLAPDEQRQLNPLLYRRGEVQDTKAPFAYNRQPFAFKDYSPAAYSFNFTLSLWANDMDSSIQVLESILPYFKPEVSVKVKEEENLPIMNDIHVVFNSVSKQDNYMEGFDEDRYIQWDMEFTVYSNIWTPSSEKFNVITDITLDLHDDMNITENAELCKCNKNCTTIDGDKIPDATEIPITL